MNNILKFLLFFSLISPSWADDAVEAAATGTIVFEKAAEIIMQDETLTISRAASKNFGEENFSIDVDFHFKNISDHDVTRKIAFVLPPVQCRMDENSMWEGLDYHDNTQTLNKGLKDFTTTVDNQPQVFTIRTEAMLGEKNITNLLKKLQIPLNPCKVQMTAAGKPDPRYSADLQKYHLLTLSNEAAWSENIYFEWTQLFPAGKVINIHHHYTPIIGEAVPGLRTMEELNSWFTGETPPLYPIWNRNPATLSDSNPSIIYNKIDETNGDGHMRFCIIPEWVRYHLTTGAYWNGGIGLFKLIIKDEVGAPFAVNQFYKGNDSVQTSMDAHTMSFIIKNFVPAQNLLILFLSLPQSTENFKSCGM